MLTLPSSVARMIAFQHVHPVTAWRQYYGASIEDLAKLLNVPTSTVIRLENSNEHIQAAMLTKLCQVFGVKPEALSVRFHYHEQKSYSEDLWEKLR